MALTIPVNADFLVSLQRMQLASSAMGASPEYVDEGVTGSAVLKDASGSTVATVSEFTYASHNGNWYAAFDKQALTDGASYTIEITLTAPVDDYRVIRCKAATRGAQ